MGASPSPGGAIDLRYSSGPLWDNSSKSYPAQNVSPFPYNTATAHSSSISKFRKASASSSAVSALTALRFSGRAIETRYILPSWSVSTKVLFSLLEEATREGILKACGRIRRAKRESAILQEVQNASSDPQILGAKPGTSEFLWATVIQSDCLILSLRENMATSYHLPRANSLPMRGTVQKQLYLSKNDCDWDKQMTSTKEGKSDESSSGEDEEPLRELVSFQRAREILYKFSKLLCLWSGALWDLVVMLDWLLWSFLLWALLYPNLVMSDWKINEQ